MVFTIPSAVKVTTPFLKAPVFAIKLTLIVPLFLPELAIGINQDALDETFQERLEETVAVTDPPAAGKVVEVGDTIIWAPTVFLKIDNVLLPVLDTKISVLASPSISAKRPA